MATRAKRQPRTRSTIRPSKAMAEQVNLDQAIFYIDQHGTILEKARLLYLLMEVEPSPEVYMKLLSLQNPDGGFPSRPKGASPSSIDSTLTSLWQLDELGMFAHPAAQSALGYLANMQHPDGSWDENPALPQHDLPPWIQPGSQATILYLTVYAAFWLGVRSSLRSPAAPQDEISAAFVRALAFIAQQQETEGKIPGYFHNSWMGISALLLGSDAYAQPAARGIAYLSGLPDSEWEDSQLAWALDCLSRAGLLADHPLVRPLLTSLIQRQSAEGSWASEDGPANAASATVNALKVIKRLTSLPPLA
jgi:hypothetical protein